MDDLRSARQVSKAWRDAASSTVAAITFEAGDSHLPEATSAFREAGKLHIVVRRAELRRPNRDTACSDQCKGVMQDTGKSATESAMLTAQLPSLQDLKPRALLCIEIAGGLKLSTPEQQTDLLLQLCQPLLELQTRATTPDENDILGFPGTSTITKQAGSSRGNRRVDLGSKVTSNASSSSPEPMLAAARAGGPRSTRTLHSSRSSSSSSSQVAARSHCSLLLKLPWLPSPPTHPAAWSMLLQLTSLQTLLLCHALTGETVADLADVAPHLTQLSLTVTGRDSRLCKLSQLQKLNSLHIRAINTNHKIVSRGIFGLSQLRHLHISGDLVLQTPGTGSASNWLSKEWPQLQTLTLQQPLSPAQIAALTQHHNGHRKAAEQPSAGSGNSTNSNCVARHACGLQKLSVWVEDSTSDIPACPWYDSNIDILRFFQQAIHLGWQAGIIMLFYPLGGNNETVAMDLAAVAMSQLLRHPSDPDAGTLLQSALLQGSSRPSSNSSAPLCSSPLLRTLEDSNNHSLRSSQLGTAVPGHAGLQQLLVRCGAWCDLSALLQQSQPQELTVATVPAGADILQQAGVAVYSHMISFTSVPRPRLMVLFFKAGTDQMLWCLKSLNIDTSPTQAGLILHGVLLQLLARSCPSLVWLQLKGILDINQAAVTALGQGCKDLEALTLIDTRVQTLEYLAKTIAAIADTSEPEQQRQQRLRRLAAAWRRFAWAGILSGMAVGIRQPKRWRGALLWAIVNIATMCPHALEIDATQYWVAQVMALQKLTAAADVYTNRGRVPRLMACWLPSGLRRLHLESCELCSHSRCLGCEAFAERAQRDGVDAKVRVVEECITAEGRLGSEPLNLPRVQVVQNRPASLARDLHRSLRACERPLLRLHLKGWGTFLCILAAGKGLVMVGNGVGSSVLRLACRA